MKELPLITIVVPVYKVEPYIHRAVDSILQQTYTNLEIILVDDGSPDGCPTICDNYARQDNRVRVIHKLNGGLSDARNAGMKIARGEYIMFVDSDDYIANHLIDCFLTVIKKERVDIVCCGLNIINNEGHIYDYRKTESSFKSDGISITKLLLSDRYPYNFSHSKIYRRKLFDGIWFPVGRIYEDSATTYRVMDRAHSVYCMKESMYYYEREREGNITSELGSSKAAWSYYCGCINCKEQLMFCRQNAAYLDMIPTIVQKLSCFTKLCIESAITLGKGEYTTYCKKLKTNIEESSVRTPLRLKLIMHFKSVYYYIYPLIKKI